MADRIEKDLPKSDYLSYLRGISPNGDSVNFDVVNMFTLLYRGIIAGDKYQMPNELKHGVYYKNKIDNGTIEQLYPYQDGFIIVLFIGDGIAQIHIHPTNGQITMRARWGGVWYTHVIK